MVLVFKTSMLFFDFMGYFGVLGYVREISVEQCFLLSNPTNSFLLKVYAFPPFCSFSSTFFCTELTGTF